MAPDDEAVPLLNMDAQVGVWLYDESDSAAHALVHTGATVTEEVHD